MWFLRLVCFAVCFQIEFCHFKRILMYSEIPFNKIFWQRKKRKKKKAVYLVVRVGLTRFLRKILPFWVEIFFKTRRAWPFQTKPSAYHCDLFYSFAIIFFTTNPYLLNAFPFFNSNGVLTLKKINYTLSKSDGIWGQV